MELHLNHTEGELGEDCPHCGNPKFLGSCSVCSKETQRREYKMRMEEQVKRTSQPEDIKRVKEKLPEIPKDSEGRPLYGPGSTRYEETKRRLIHKKTA